MSIFICSLIFLLCLTVGYLFGSFPSAIFIGKVFYGVDVRTVGSHNAGGTNVGRVLGAKAGLITMALDIFKTILAIWITYVLVKYIPALNESILEVTTHVEIFYYLGAGVGALLGHSYPVFAGFKGGKSMSVYAGIIASTNWLLIILGLSTFFIILAWKKYVSLASMLASNFVSVLGLIICLFPNIFFWSMWPGLELSLYYDLVLWIASIYVVIRHIPNIKRLVKKEERKIHWMQKKGTSN